MNYLLGTYTYSFVATEYNQEFTNHIFTAKVYDANGNLTNASSTEQVVDCQPVKFSSSGIVISQDNGDNPIATVANINDVLTVYASAAAYLDATVQATIGSGTVDFATGTMIFNSSLNRHEVTFTVSAPGTGGWGIQRGNNLYFKLTAVDDVGNVANMVQANSAFTVRNEPPTVTATFTLNPDYGLANPVYNLGTSTVGDLLNVTCNFANDVPINKAWLDFSQLSSGTLDLIINGSSAATLSGIGSSKFAAFDGVNKEIYLIARDDGGNSDRATATYFIDNVAPTISSAQFDGSIIKVNLSEEYTNASLNIDEWTLVGSNTVPVGTTAYLNFPIGQTVNHSLTDFEIVLDNAQKITVAQWASTSLYLQVTNTASSAVTDLTQNEIRPINFAPVTITDSSWREPARVTSLVMTQTWPTSIVLDFTFNKDVDPATLQASSGVLLFQNLTYDYSSVDYADGYVFQPTLDTVSWSDNKHLRITLSSNGREWVARKLGNGSNKLRFATRSGRVFVKDFLTKDMQAISSQAALEATDNRPPPAFDFDAATPELDMASRSLKLTASDRLLLFTNDFARANATEPLMLMPVPTLTKRVSGFHNKITLHEFDSGSSVVLQLEDLQLPTDNLYASSTIALKLTATDVNNVINLFQSSAAPDWRLQINAGTFTNLWGTNNTAYLPSGNPGPLNMIYPAGYNPVTVAACSMSDKPPVSQKTAGQLTFEVEVYPANLDGVDLPVQTQIQPTAQIIRQDTGAVICNGTFVSYTNRTVNSKTRTVARFTNAADFPTNLQRIPARIEVNGIRDIFNASYNVVASFAYDLALKNDTAPDGFSDTASAPIEIDTQKPTVVQVIPGDYIGRLPAGSEFRVEFSEAMDPLLIPTLRLATGTTTMSFTFHSWLATDLAKFTNNTAFTSATTNGTWTWEVTGGRDEATNTHDGTSSFLVEVRTYAPEVAAGNVRITTVQTTIDNTIRIDQPWSQQIGAATFAIQYTTAPTQYLPHYLEIYDDSNVRYGRVPVTAVSTANTATATFASANFDIDPGLTGPTTYRIRIIDSAMNQTESVANLVYDNLAPDVNSFALTGIGSESATVSYYNPMVGNFTLNVTTTSTTDNLRLAIYSYASNATTTYNMNQPLPGNYQISTGDLLTNGTYTMSIVDLAGNLGTGPSVRRLVVDNQVPTVLAVSPSGLIGNSPIGGTTFTVIFSDNMDASLAVVPTLTLATSSATISMNFAGWADPAMASTAYYTNAVEIASSMPSGFYNYNISGGRDLAGNAMLAPSVGTFKVEIQTKGPFAQIDVYTDQAHIYATQQKNLAFNPAFGPATFNIDYSGGPFNNQHSLLVFDSTDVQVASIAIPIADPASIVYAGVHPTGTYRFKIRDAEDNISGSYLPEPFYVDVDIPNINNVIAMQGSGIASDTGAGLIHFLSPLQGNSTFLATTTANEELIMLLRDISPATSTYPMVGSATSHNVSIGSTLADGAYDVLFADRAGNIAIGTASSARLIVDSASPTVTVATPNISGGIAAGTGVFVITFDEHMNTAIAPTATIATGSTIINLGSPVWLDSFRCQFTNTTNLSGYAPGSYSYQVTGARDLAGNPNVNPTPGSFSIDLFTQAPVVTATLRSQQNMLSGSTELLNRPFSINAMPGIATLSLNYSSGPFQAPHNMLVYNSSNQLVSNIVVNPDIANKVATVTVDAAFFGTPGNVGPGEYRFRMVDSIGNLSATNTLPLIYDAIGPDITAAGISTVSDGSNNPLYYNQALHGDLKVKFTSTATDSLLLVAANGIATAAYSMTLNDTADEYSATVTTAQAALLSTGTYVITAFDLAGNMASGAASTTVLIIDRDLPQVLSVLSLNGTPLTSEPAGGATFTVTFNEPMKASATPVLKLATSTKTIACTFESWLSTTQARFVTAEAITPDLPQGEYNYQVTATDLTGNVLNNAVVGTVQIRSRGPVVASIYTQSYQSTTASGTSEILRDMPFSFNVAPGAATLTVQLAQAPDAAPIDLHFMQSGVTVASYPLVLSGTAATFTWSATNGPNPAFPTTYQVKLVDASGDFSLESYNWTMDASAPVALTDPTVTRGVIATGAVYFNPARHSYLNVKFSASETSAPKMRVRGSISTDTYDLSTAGTNQWSGNFDGRFSRGTSPKPLMPDGTYALDLVDQAGNVGMLASGDPILYNIVIDTQSPGISTYSTLVAGLPVTSYSPAAGNLEIRVVSGEALNETGIYWMEVLNSSNIKINQLRVNNSGGNKSAFWDGKNSAGTTVLDGTYSFRATDYAGNPATGSISVFALTTAFKVVGVSQISSSTAKLIFNHEVNPNLSGAVITAPGLTVTNLNRIEPQAVSFTVVPNFVHQTNYTFTITPNTIVSIYGAGINSPDNTGILTADGQGPKLAEVSFAGLSGQQEFKVIFDETFSAASAGNVGKYSLTGPSGAVALSAATTQSDAKTVLLTASQNLIENADYQISVTGIEDTYGNLSPTANSLSFKGRDLTAPTLEVSAFSNPANENDIIVVVVSNEDLKAAPVLQIAQSNAPIVTTTMQTGANSKSFMIGVHLSTSYPGNGTLLATAQDLAGNQGSGNSTFTVAYISASKVASLVSADNSLTAEFAADSLKEDAVIKIMTHRLEKGSEANSQIRTALQLQAKLALGMRASQTASGLNQSELEPVSDAYEISISSAKVNKGFNVFVEMPAASSATGLGLFYQDNNQWKFISAAPTRGNKLATRISTSQMLAILHDTKAPEVTISTDINLAEPFRTARPEFKGKIVEAGSGLDLTTVSASIDSGPAQNVTVDAGGNFTFIPQADLTGGWHDLVIRASDNTGNVSAMAPARFEVTVPLQITQIAQYPNPARVRTFVRISANRGDIDESLVRVRIYDVAGHKVATLDGIRPVNEKWGINARFVYDIPWDLRNTAGKDVANGVYFARIEVRDPDDQNRKVKETFKIAILR
ncbi:MAG: Ig-like domain-containing protein [Candidatus Riflebacteria bacterium]